ncbi:hypothetical protein [Candidiatus Paracoxiella cheracis]|uniref:hypothetical protein n=1 Tax=Candidiatus Paracoxiella cheracis TaxID=3405120 RepID=UPI003BF4B88C
MAAKNTDSFISTDAKVLINDWQALHKIIEAHTQLTTEQLEGDHSSSLTTLLSERQLTDALAGPYQKFFKQKLSAYATIVKLRLEITLQEDESLKIPDDDAQETNSTFKALLEKYTLNDLNKIQAELDQLTNEHNEQWETQLAEWNQQLLMSVIANQIPLTNIEIEAFKDKEPLSELINLYNDLNIDLPKLDFADFNFEQYLKLKLELVIRSSLHRRHEAHELTDISRIMKKFKSDFATIHQQEQQLVEKQKVDTQRIVEPITVSKSYTQPR